MDITEQGCELWSVVCTRKELADQKICADFKKMELWICSGKPSSRGSGEMWLVPSWRNPCTTTSFSLRPQITYLLETIFQRVGPSLNYTNRCLLSLRGGNKAFHSQRRLERSHFPTILMEALDAQPCTWFYAQGAFYTTYGLILLMDSISTECEFSVIWH